MIIRGTDQHGYGLMTQSGNITTRTCIMINFLLLLFFIGIIFFLSMAFNRQRDNANALSLPYCFIEINTGIYIYFSSRKSLVNDLKASFTQQWENLFAQNLNLR